MESTALGISTYDEPFTLVVEPWAPEYKIAVGDECRVVANHPTVRPTFEAAWVSGKLIVTVCEGGATFEFWRNGALDDRMDIPIPW